MTSDLPHRTQAWSIFDPNRPTGTACTPSAHTNHTPTHTAHILCQHTHIQPNTYRHCRCCDCCSQTASHTPPATSKPWPTPCAPALSSVTGQSTVTQRSQMTQPPTYKPVGCCRNYSPQPTMVSGLVHHCCWHVRAPAEASPTGLSLRCCQQLPFSSVTQ